MRGAGGGGGGGGGGAVNPLPLSQPARSEINAKAVNAVQVIVFISFPLCEDAGEACRLNDVEPGSFWRDLPCGAQGSQDP